MHGVSHIPAQKGKLVVITALLMWHLMKIDLRSNNCKAQEAVASAGWLQRASSPLIYPLQSEGAILFSTDGTQHQDWLNTNLAPPSVFSCLLWITDSRQSVEMFLYFHIPFFFCYFQASQMCFHAPWLFCDVILDICALDVYLRAARKVIQKCSKHILITILLSSHWLSGVGVNKSLGLCADMKMIHKFDKFLLKSWYKSLVNHSALHIVL